MIKMPNTKIGNWSVGLNAFFLIITATSIGLVKILKVLYFNYHWWDVVVLFGAFMDVVVLYAGTIGIAVDTIPAYPIFTC